MATKISEFLGISMRNGLGTGCSGEELADWPCSCWRKTHCCAFPCLRLILDLFTHFQYTTCILLINCLYTTYILLLINCLYTTYILLIYYLYIYYLYTIYWHCFNRSCLFTLRLGDQVQVAFAWANPMVLVLPQQGFASWWVHYTYGPSCTTYKSVK